MFVICLRKRIGLFYQFKGTELKRFQEHLWFAVYYTIQTSIGFYLLKDAVWIKDLEFMLKDFPHWEDDSLWIRFYYVAQFGFYIQALYTLIFVDERMKDFSELVLHHCFTLLLISMSLISRYHRIGSYVLILHDVVDVILYNGKVIHYLKFETLSNIIFAIFIFFGLGFARLVLFPRLVVFLWTCNSAKSIPAYHYTFARDSTAHPLFEVTSYGMCVGQICISSALLYSIGCIALIILHSYWFLLALKIAYTTLITGKIVDIREQDSCNKTTGAMEHMKLE